MKGNNELLEIATILQNEFIPNRKKWNIEAAENVEGKWHLIISSESEKEQENENVETDC
jgi:hypothetical protein